MGSPEDHLVHEHRLRRGSTGDRVFLRKASGLIKTAGTTDVFIYNVGLVSIGIGIGGLLLYGPSVYPGGNLYVGVLLAL